MKRASLTLTVAIAIALLAGCEGQRDSSGAVVSMSAPQQVDVAEFPLRLTDLFPAGSFGGFARAQRDGGQAFLDTVDHVRGGGLQYQWASTGWFDNLVEQRLARRADFERWVGEVLPRLGHRVDAAAEIAPASHNRYRSVGFTYLGAGPAPGTLCFLGRAGYRVRGRTIYQNDELGIDATLLGIHCGSAPEAERFVRLFSTVVATAPH